MNTAKGRRSTKQKPRYEAYRAKGTRTKNKIIKIMKHLLRHEGDKQSQDALERLK
jgi:hypothetical protein